MYYVKEGEKFRKSLTDPESMIICGWKEWGEQSEKEKGIHVFTRSRNYYGELEKETFELYTTEAALSDLEEAIKENMKKHDELISQHLCILEEKAIAEPDLEPDSEQ